MFRQGKFPSLAFVLFGCVQIGSQGASFVMYVCVCHFSESLLCHKADEISSFLRDCTQPTQVSLFLLQTCSSPFHQQQTKTNTCHMQAEGYLSAFCARNFFKVLASIFQLA
jgi:hypothetical protein